MEENKENNKKTIEEKSKEFKQVNLGEMKKKSNFSFGKNVGVPFLSGVLGAGIVLGTCLGVPSIRSNILNGVEINSKKQSDENLVINPTQISLKDFSETGIAVARKVKPSIVGIKVEYTINSLFLSQQGKGTAEGSGIIITENGYILTNNHVINSSSDSSFYEIDEASKVSVFLDGDQTEYPAKVIGSDAETDLAVIKIEKDGLVAAELGNSDEINVGEFAMAVGNPLGMQSSVTAGIISAVDRDVMEKDGKIDKLIQTDVAINSGNSGGALVNSEGKVIGINTLKVAATGVEGMGFAIPINSAKPIYDQLVEFKKVKRPYIGIRGMDLDEKTAKENNLIEGIYVKIVDDFSAAEKAGIRPGDVIIKVDGKNIKTFKELQKIKDEHKIGDTLKITVNRNGKEKEMDLILQEK